jgi:hypothetical protein
MSDFHVAVAVWKPTRLGHRNFTPVRTSHARSPGGSPPDHVQKIEALSDSTG